MLAPSSVLGTLADLESVGTCSVAITAARAASALVMDPKLDLAQRALSFDYRSDSSLGLSPPRLAHALADPARPVTPLAPFLH
jgi:hypothetical protein